MLVRWDGGAPPDADGWFEVLREALGAEVFYWVRFYREPEGWRFDLECRQASGPNEPSFKRADETIALHVYRLLVESGKPLDPGWRPVEPSPPAAVARTPAAIVASEAAPLGEALPPLSETKTEPNGATPVVQGSHRSRRRKRRPPPQQPLGESTPSVSETKAESVEATPVVPVLEPEPPSEAPPPAPRPPRWPGFLPAIVYLPAVLLVAFAGWLSRDRLLSPSASPPAPSPSATVSQEALAAEKRLNELEAMVARLKQERDQAIPARRPAAPAQIGATRQVSGRPPAPAAQERTAQILVPTPTPAAPPTPMPATALAAAPAPTDVSLPSDPPVSTDAAVTTAPVPAAAAEPPPTPPPLQRGAMVDVNDPDLTPPVLMKGTQPRYPPLALERRLSGTVWLRALVDETGAVLEVSLVRVSPQRFAFEDAATRSVRTRVYRPATKQGVPVRVWLPIVVEFRHPGR